MSVDRKNRLVARFTAAATLLLLLVLVNLTIYTVARGNSERILAEAPSLAPLLADQSAAKEGGEVKRWSPGLTQSSSSAIIQLRPKNHATQGEYDGRPTC